MPVAPSPASLSVWRNGVGPLPGLRLGDVAVYEFDVHPKWFTLRERPSRPVRQRAFLLLKEDVQLNQPVGFAPEMQGWWYVDLVSFVEEGTTLRVQDEYLDVIVGPPDRPYRVLDLDEYADALSRGLRTPQQVAAGMTAFRAFIDRHLNNRHDPNSGWPDFPPAALEPVLHLAVPDPYTWAARTGTEE